MIRKIVLASDNPGKIKEIQAILQGRAVQVLPQSQFVTPQVEETGLTFVENAILKARNAAKASGLPAIADDSGLEVDALGGAPGVFSSRYAGPQASDQENLQKLLHALEGVPDEQRTARFHCVMVLLRHPRDPSPLIGQGAWEGFILHEARGAGGFGYDPIFGVLGKNCSSAELSAQEKNALSHRGKALRALVEQWDRSLERVQ